MTQTRDYLNRVRSHASAFNRAAERANRIMARRGYTEEDSLLSSMRFDHAYTELMTRLGTVGRF